MNLFIASVGVFSIIVSAASVDFLIRAGSCSSSSFVNADNTKSLNCCCFGADSPLLSIPNLILGYLLPISELIDLRPL